MSLFNFFTKRNKPLTLSQPVPDSVGKSAWTGGDFYMLITGATEIDKNEYDIFMTPTTLEWSRMNQIKWPIYKVGNYEYSFSFEKLGIEITFSDTIQFDKAKQIGDEIVDKLRSFGQIVELHVFAHPKLHLYKM